MSQCRKRKCLHCQALFRPDPRNRKHQRYCAATPCRKASKAASQQRWLNKPENQDYFCGAVNVGRVQAWRSAHPGYARRSRALSRQALQDHSLRQTVDCNSKTGTLAASPLQDLCLQQPAVLIGLIASFTGQALQEEIAVIARRLLTLGEDILNHPQGATHATPIPAMPTTPAPYSAPVQLDRSALGP